MSYSTTGSPQLEQYAKSESDKKEIYEKINEDRTFRIKQSKIKDNKCKIKYRYTWLTLLLIINAIFSIHLITSSKPNPGFAGTTLAINVIFGVIFICINYQNDVNNLQGKKAKNDLINNTILYFHCEECLGLIPPNDDADSKEYNVV